MKVKKNPIWSTGIEEILQHAEKLIQGGTSSGLRISLILIDNAVELIFKTYLSLPKRETGIKLTRKELEAAFQVFPVLIETFEINFPGVLSSDQLSEVEYLQKVRNQLYHEGSGLTVSSEMSLSYLKTAVGIISTLFNLEYIVEKGDTLAKISTKLFGNTKHWKMIARQNEILTPKQLKVGMVIQIPILGDVNA